MKRLLQATLVLAVVVTFSGLANQASAGCHGGFSFGYQRPVYKPYYKPCYKPVVVKPVCKPVVVKPVVAKPAVVAPVKKLTKVPAGSTLTLPGGFGPEAGHVFLLMGKVKLPVKVENWGPEGITIQLPPMAVAAPAEAYLDIVQPSGKLADHIGILLVAPPKIVIHG